MKKVMFKQKRYIVVILVLMIIEPTLNSVLNFWLQSIFNGANVNSNKFIIMKMLTLGFMLWLLKRILSYTSSVLKNKYICISKYNIKKSMFEKILKLQPSYGPITSNAGQYISMFTNDVNLIEQRYLDQMISLVSNIFSILILGASFMVLNLKLSIPILIFGSFSMFVPLIFSNKLNQKNLEYSNSVSNFTQKLKEFFTGYPTIKNYAIEKNVMSKFNQINFDAENKKYEADIMISLANNVGILLSWFMQFIAVGIGVMYVIRGEIMIGTVISAQSFASDLAAPLQNILINLNSIRSIKEVVNRIDLLMKNDEYDMYISDITHELERCDLEYKNVTLKLNNQTIIDHFSYKFEDGKKYLIIGENGSGKSSLFKLLKKWYKYGDEVKGDIFLNDMSFAYYNNYQLSFIISYLSEKVHLFSESVKDNITLFREYGSNMINEVVDKAKVQLDMNKVLIDEGKNISSGEQRRIEIARSLINPIKILIFDEVISTLDIETAYEIEKMALSLSDQTVIFISHNFSGKLIKEYDEILIMDHGKLIDHGHYNQLIEESDYFKKLCDIKFV